MLHIKPLKASQHLNRNVSLLTQAQLDEYIRRLEEAETNIRIAEAKIAERDQRIIEVERLLGCMGTVRTILNITTIYLHFLQMLNLIMKKYFYRKRINSTRSCRNVNSVSA